MPLKITDSQNRLQAETPAGAAQGSSFETVRELLAGSEPTGATTEEGSSFDLIRERLLNTRPRHQPDQSKSLRRKNSRKRRRNVSRVLKANFFKIYFEKNALAYYNAGVVAGNLKVCK
jgi:hypothetical protein